MAKKCKTCEWWDSEHPRLEFAPAVPGISNPGFCRKRLPGAYMLQNYHIGIQPIMDGEDGCAAHRERGQ